MAGDSIGSWEWFRAHRIGLGPAYAALPVLVLGIIVHLLDSGPALLLITAYAIGTLFWAGRAQGWRRPYFAAAGLTSACWLLWAHLVDASLSAWVWLVCSLSLATVLGAIPWWSDSVRRTHVKMEIIVKNWSIRADRIGLRNTWLSNVKVTEIGWTGKLNWRPGEHDVDRVEGMRKSLEGALGLQVGELRMPLDGKSTHSINLVAVLKDPHAAAVMWTIPHVEVTDPETGERQMVLRRHSVLDEIEIGLREDGSKKRIRLFRKGHGALHALIGGMTGSGKSGLLNLLWGWLAMCTDVVQWGVDLKGGVELGPWRKCFDWVVRTREGAISMFELLNVEMVRRLAVMEKRGIRVWQPTPEEPVIAVSMDECASLLGDADGATLKLVEEVARKGRAAGIILILATQYPTLEAIGTSQIREQLHYGFVFRMKTSKGEGFIITETTVDAHKIDSNRQGTCYVQEGNEVDKMPTRVYFLDDPTVVQVVDVVADLVPCLVREVEEFLAAQCEEYADREMSSENERDENENRSETPTETVLDWSETGSETLGGITEKRDETLSEVEQRQLARDRDSDNEPERLDEEQARAALLSALRDAGDEGVQAKDLMAVCTRKSTWLYDQLNPMLAAGEVARTKTGRWALITQKVHSR